MPIFRYQIFTAGIHASYMTKTPDMSSGVLNLLFYVDELKLFRDATVCCDLTDIKSWR
jgi:hypothetical protein